MLSDLIESGCVPVHRLEHVYRQTAGSLIITNAHRILRGELPELPERGDTDADFYFFPADDPEACADRDHVRADIPDVERAVRALIANDGVARAIAYNARHFHDTQLSAKRRELFLARQVAEVARVARERARAL